MITAVKSGDNVSVEYEGRLEDGTLFDTNMGKKPLEFVIGVGLCLKAFEDGIIGMQEGTVKEIIIPSGEGYMQGELANKKLIFKVKLLKIN